MENMCELWMSIMIILEKIDHVTMELYQFSVGINLPPLTRAKCPAG